jgi:hypothetical protein
MENNMKTLREILTQHNSAQGWDTSEEGLEESLRESFDVVWKGDEDVRRWRINYSVVCKIVDEGIERFFMYSACKGTNDNSWEDAGYEFEGIDNVVEVFPKEVKTTIYVNKENL